MNDVAHIDRLSHGESIIRPNRNAHPNAGLPMRTVHRFRFKSNGTLEKVLILAACILMPLQSHADTINLCTLLQSGGTVTLSSSNTYPLPGQCNLSQSVTVIGNGITVEGVGPIVVQGAGVTLTVDHLLFHSSAWAALAAVNGAHVILQNQSLVSCQIGSALYADTDSTLTVQSSAIESSALGVQVINRSDAFLHGLTVTNTPIAVMVGGTQSSLTLDESSRLDYSATPPPGAYPVGVALLEGAQGIVRDSQINGFTNGIDIQSASPTINGTVDVENCTFDGNGSALAALYARNIGFSASTVTDSLTDGLYFNSSSAVVDGSQIIGSGDTGVTFIGCPEGTVQNSLVKGSGDQGIAAVAESPATPPILNIKVLNNTLVDNRIANLLVDERSTAVIRGNIFTQTPDSDNFQIRFHGPRGITLDSALVMNSRAGMEIKGSSTPNIVLSNISQNNTNGILVYDNSSLNVEHSLFWNNGLTETGTTSGSWSIFANTGATVVAHGCTFGPSTAWGFYNNSTQSCDVSSNHWDASDGPNASSWILPPGAVNGTGARLSSSYNPSAPVTVAYTPFLDHSPVDSVVDSNVSLASGGTLSWGPELGVTLQLTANPGSTGLSGETAGVLRVNDTECLNSVVPPPGLALGQLYVVWISAPLRLNSASGSLIFSVPSVDGEIILKRRNDDGTWTAMPGSWNETAHELTYDATDPNLLNGTFALTQVACQPCMPDLINYFYNTILGRAPEPGAVDAWQNGYFNYALNFNIDVKFIPIEMGRGFFLSAEYQARNRTNAEFITDCYRAFLHRDPYAWELDGWLSGVWNRPEVMSMFANSAEFAGYIENLFPGFSGLPTRNFVTTMYIGLLDRLVDIGGLLYWSDLFDNAADKVAMAKWMAEQVAGSPEFQANVTTHEGLVIRLYRSFLGRFPSDGEIAYWSGELAAGRQTLTQLIDLFGSSNEFTQIINRYF